MFSRRRTLRLETERMALRLPQHADFNGWTSLRQESRDFLTPWEPVWAPDHLTRKAFTTRVYWAQRASRAGTAIPLFMERSVDGALLGAITLDNIRRGPAQMATVGYWIGARFARQGYMSEALAAVVRHAFGKLDLSRIEAACLPDNAASRGVLERSGFKYEGVAQGFLQINGRWRTHVLYANLRHDRRGRTDVA
ncbi:GNAT family N-acetyltransferase [Paracoccus jeotgali]|uniref:30S ribosomal protein S5 alanine N-acetyltransferase n=1 Tax=Paracoccus jeotgali TaxID=2065379 RepID=A0A2K9MC08_9RHOB|nr:GNAT family protein [Paracoccus jeotgali]AUM73179.1 30S ribosomal protein S5 alanine N-acetyltransferase [Paracoccus jeotgali]